MMGFFWLTVPLLMCACIASAQDSNVIGGDSSDDSKDDAVCRLDIGFVLDGSGSVGEENWKRTLEFVQDFVKIMTMDGAEGNRFGVVSFGNSGKLNIGLEDYIKVKDLLDEVINVRYLDENTNTAAGLRTMRKRLFDPTNKGERGDRPGVQNIAIVVTDGASTRETEETIPEAQRARSDNIVMFALGVGPREKLNEDELMAIVGYRKEYLYYLADYTGLMGSVEDIYKASCQIPIASTTTTTTSEPLANPCDKLDIVFLLDASGSIEDTNFVRIRKFARDFVNELTLGPDHTHVALVSYSTHAQLDFNLTTYQSKAAVIEAIETLPWWNQMTNTSGALRIAHSQVFGTVADRLDAPNLAIVLTDGQSNRDAELVPIEAGKLHMKDVNVMAIGAGIHINMAEINWIASEPKSYYTRMFDSVTGLTENFQEMFRHICTPERPVIGEILDHRTYPVDLALVFDDADIPVEQYNNMINVMVSMAYDLFYGPQFHQIAVATTAGGPNFPLDFDDFENREDILNIIQNLQHREGHGNLDITMEYVRYNLFHRDRGDRSNIPNVAVIFTSGFPNIKAGDIANQAAQMKQEGILVLLVTALPLEVDFEQYIIGIPSDPSQVYWFKAFNYPDPNTLALAILQAVSMSYVPVDWECTFEQKQDGEKSACGIAQETNADQFDWKIGKGSTPSRLTGPSSAFSGDYYMFIEASIPRKPGDTATMYLPFAPDREEKWCLKFHYNMYGHHIGSLQIVLIRPGASDDICWMKNGPQGEEWLMGMVTLHVEANFKVAIRAVRAEAYSGDIAIDNLEVSRGLCPRIC